MTLTAPDILTRIQSSSPLSIIRCGDGEGIVLNALSSVSALQLCNESVMKRQMGYYPILPHIEAIRNNLIDAYSLADIIGVPMHQQKTNSHWTSVQSILDTNVPVHTDQYCSIDLCYDMLYANQYRDILQNRPVLNYISCRDLDESFQRNFNIGVVNKFIIAPEAKFTGGYDGDVHYPTQFNRIPRWMDCQHPEGKLLLVGAGVIGKIYCKWWRDRGGIAIDIGGVMDLWYGRKTRGEGRGLDVEYDKYKL